MKTDLKVLLLTKIFPPRKGGVPNYYKNLLQHLNRVKAFVITSVINNARHQLVQPLKQGIHIHLVERVTFFPEYMGLQLKIGWWFDLGRMLIKLIHFVKNDHIDIIIVGQVQMFLLLAAFFASRITGIPYVLFLHGEEIPQIPMKSNRILRWLYRKASGYLCNSNFTRQRLRKFIGLKDIEAFVVHPGVEERFFTTPSNLKELEERTGLKNKKIIYTIARLDERKGQDMVIRSLPAIIRDCPEVVYLIGGQGPKLGYLKELVSSMKLESHVRFLGLVPEEELVAYHYLGNVFVMPNRILEDGDTEGFGIVFLEANAAGNPVIGGKEGGSVDAIVDGITGYLVDPLDTEDISKKILSLLKDEDMRMKMGAAGKKRAWEEFRWPQLAEKFERNILAILNLGE